MARAAPKKLKAADSPSGAKGNGSILSFFGRTPSDSAANGGNGGNGGGGTAHGGHARGSVPGRQVSGTSREDVKPDIGSIGRKVSAGSKQGKEKAVPKGIVRGDSGHGLGSVDDPMVISDEEDVIDQPAPATHRLRGGETDAIAAPTRPKMPAGKSDSDFGTWDIDVDMTDAPGPSRPASRVPSRSRSPALLAETPPKRDQSCSPPPPFAGMPEFKPPSSWPQIVNTAAEAGDLEDDDGFMVLDNEELPDGAAVNGHRPKGDTPGPARPVPNGDKGDSGSNNGGEADNDGDDDSIADRSDGSHADDDPDVDVDDADGGDIELLEPEEPRQPEPAASRAPDLHSVEDPAETIHQPFAGLDMEWGDDAEEGMGMDDFGEEEGLDLDEPAAGVLGKRKDKKGASGSALAGGAKEKGKGDGKGKGGKLDTCPVCDKVLKGKSDAIVLQHINTCLDSSPSARTPSSSKGKTAARPISSFAPLSPAPSPTPSPPPYDDDDTPANGAGAKNKGPNAFSVLMSGHKEREQWKDAEIDLKRDGKRTFGRRKAPFYKVMTGMPVAVDAFRYGGIPKVTAYLLS